MKISFLLSAVFATMIAISGVAHAASGDASVERQNGKTTLYLQGEVADEIYRRIEMEPGDNNTKVGENIRCTPNGDETVCVLVMKELPDGNLTGGFTKSGK